MAELAGNNIKSTTHRQGRPTVHAIQLLRAIAAVLVALFHGQKAFSTHISQPAFETESYLFGFGGVGVHVFFVISGFVMVYTSRFENGFDATHFYRRRLLRIYPIYWLCAGLYLITCAILGTPYDLSAGAIVSALLLLPAYAAAIIAPAWTLSYEMFFYLCFGTAMLLGLTRGLIVLTAAFVGSIALGLVVRPENPFWHLVTNGLLLEFIAGAVIGWLLVKDKLPRRGGYTLIGLAVLLFVAGIAWGYSRLPSAVMWGLPSTLLIAGAVILESARGSSSFVRRVSILGDSSYALYLIHFLVIILAVQLAGVVPAAASLEPIVASAGITVFAVIVAELLHRQVERPALARLNPKRALVPQRGGTRVI